MITRAFKVRRGVRAGTMTTAAGIKRLTQSHAWDYGRAVHFLGLDGGEQPHAIIGGGAARSQAVRS